MARAACIRHRQTYRRRQLCANPLVDLNLRVHRAVRVSEQADVEGAQQKALQLRIVWKVARQLSKGFDYATSKVDNGVGRQLVGRAVALLRLLLLENGAGGVGKPVAAGLPEQVVNDIFHVVQRLDARCCAAVGRCLGKCRGDGQSRGNVCFIGVLRGVCSSDKPAGQLRSLVPATETFII